MSADLYGYTPDTQQEPRCSVSYTIELDYLTLLAFGCLCLALIFAGAAILSFVLSWSFKCYVRTRRNLPEYRIPTTGPVLPGS